MNRYSKGLENEKRLSANIHQQGVPLLVSESILRSRGGGQIDLAILDIVRREIKIFEVKLSGQEHLSYYQYRRLKDSAFWLAQLFDYKISFDVL